MNFLKGKNSAKIIGLMSGTSLDGLDIALVDFKLNSKLEQIKLLKFKTYPYNKNFIKKLSEAKNFNSSLLSELDYDFGKIQKDLVLKFLKNNKIKLDGIAIHGHTICHEEKKYTLQIGKPDFLANEFNLPIVFDFRSSDIALNGNGAPLVIFLDYTLAKVFNIKKIAFQNLGGIGNVSFINNNSIIATDTGPANMMSNSLMLIAKNKALDKDGKIAEKGKLISKLYDELLAASFMQKKFPKTTGVEDFGPEICKKIYSNYRKNNLEDILFTLLSFSAEAIKICYLHYGINGTDTYFSGGGIKNKCLMNLLSKKLNLNSLQLFSEKFSIPDEAKEAVAFALLGLKRLQAEKNSFSSATGATKDASLGKIQLPV